jgi:RNA polymerase sigma factor (sigma-70 family)
MATAQLGVVLRHVRSLATNRKSEEETDGALLRAFLSERDQSAFEALLRRYGPMVLRVARRTLGHDQDAEDILQAAFMLLVRQAGSIRKQESLASWLHGVAYRMATHAKRAAARRRGHESQANPTQPPDPALRAAWQEIQALLDAEIQLLPENIRGAFVLCCLEHKSCAEAAGRLGLAEATVWKHLGRARKLLQERLTRRGVSLAAVLAAVAVGAKDTSAALPPSLMVSTAKAVAQLVAGQALVCGRVSARVMALVEGGQREMFLSKCKMGFLLISCVAILGTGLGLASLRRASAGPPAEAPGVEKASLTGKGPAEDLVKVRGKVLDPEGKPLAGAKLYLGHAGPKKITYTVRATSGDDGRFAFTLSKSEKDTTPADSPRYQVMAVALGHGCDWVTVAAPKEELTLRLVKDVPIRGRILDPDGRPVAGARLRVTSLSAPRGEDLGRYLEVVRQGAGAKFAKSWDGPVPGQPTVVQTGADGRFQLSGIGRERVVRLLLEGHAIATTELNVMTRVASKVGGLHGASFNYLAVASRPLRGMIRDKDTRKPLAGVTVGVWGNPWCKAISDKEGRYELIGLAKSPSYDLTVKPAAGQLYFQRSAQFKDTPGLAAVTADIDMVQGLALRGKVTDRATGKPIRQARVKYKPLFQNPYVKTKIVGDWRPQSQATTGPDGRYELAVLPGKGVLLVTGPKPDAYMPALMTHEERGEIFGLLFANDFERTYLPDLNHAFVFLQPGAKASALVKDVTLEPVKFLTLKGRVIGPDGKPLTGITVEGLSRGWLHETTFQSAEFAVEGIDPRINQQLIFHHKKKNLGLFVTILKSATDELRTEEDINPRIDRLLLYLHKKKTLGLFRPIPSGGLSVMIPRGKANEPLIVKLQPCGATSGRLVDQAGEPIAGRGVQIVALTSGYVGGGYQRVKTDKTGWFRAEGLVPACEYFVMVEENGTARTFATAVVEPGKNKDLGDIKVNN